MLCYDSIIANPEAFEWRTGAVSTTMRKESQHCSLKQEVAAAGCPVTVVDTEKLADQVLNLSRVDILSFRCDGSKDMKLFGLLPH